jgi:hypothetical protein
MPSGTPAGPAMRKVRVSCAWEKGFKERLKRVGEKVERLEG